MALTYNRPDYTATQLNTIWTTLRNGLAAVMPSAIETVAGQSNFSVIDIYDTGTSSNIGLSVVDNIDVVKTLISVSNARGAGFFSSQYVAGSTYVNDYFLVEVRDTISKNSRKNISNYDAISRTGGYSSFAGQAAYKGYLTSTGSTYVNTILASDTKSYPALLVRAKFYISTNTISVEAYKQDTGLSDYSTNIYGSPERFNDKGYGGWNLGAGGTYTYTGFLTLSGYAYFGSGSGTTLGSIETFDDGWPAGISPPSGGGTSGDHYTENLSSQITGSATTFTTSYAYQAGTLKVYWNGQRQYSGTTSELSSTTFSTTFTPTPGDVLIVDYEILTS